ncbi:MAG TPA: hypothetical protein VI997_00075 [Candidatus Thermoplasmatota archaeon]|nr:hypothetical protein [Candidatus Thermoplasmatota archaeon]
MTAVTWLAVAVATSAGLALADKRLTPVIRTYAAQSWFLGGLVLVEGAATHRVAIAAFGVAILVVKGILTPTYVGWLSRRLATGRELDPVLNIPLSLFAGGLCILASVEIADSVPFTDPEDRVVAVAGLGTVFLGLLAMATRRKAITQALGLLTTENGAFLLSLALTEGLPLGVELAVLLDVLVLLVLFGILFYRIRDTFDDLDVTAMKTLGE